MKQQTFKRYQADTISRFSAILTQAQPGTFDEQALSAYTNPNPAMRWLFWQRVAADYVVQPLATLYPLLPLFQIVIGTPRSS